MDRFSKTPSESRYGCGFQIGAPARYFLPFTVLKPSVSVSTTTGSVSPPARYFLPFTVLKQSILVSNIDTIAGPRALLLTVYGFETSIQLRYHQSNQKSRALLLTVYGFEK